MPRHNGALKRLRRDLTRAFSKHAAGFDIIRERMPQMKNVQFAQALTDCGIACSVSDVENGKRREFVPFQTIRTEETEKALLMLKERSFDGLEVDQFFAEEP